MPKSTQRPIAQTNLLRVSNHLQLVKAVCCRFYFKFVDNDFIRNGVIVGLCWFAINIILDVLILIPIMKTSFTDYFISIGLSYISIPVNKTMGYLLYRKAKI